MVAHINIGTNKGDRMANISRAVALVKSCSLSEPRLSSVIESEPWGYVSDNMFYNRGVEITTNLSPKELLSKLKDFEKEIDSSPHRDDYGNYADRVIDIDLIYVDSLVIDNTDITLPHPRMHLRKFVLLPIAELAPEWVHPVFNKTVTELLKDLS